MFWLACHLKLDNYLQSFSCTCYHHKQFTPEPATGGWKSHGMKIKLFLYSHIWPYCLTILYPPVQGSAFVPAQACPLSNQQWKPTSSPPGPPSHHLLHSSSVFSCTTPAHTATARHTWAFLLALSHLHTLLYYFQRDCLEYTTENQNRKWKFKCNGLIILNPNLFSQEVWGERRLEPQCIANIIRNY